jgi:metal-responsive CopG/Arc/MetJ family transcriptional regulator
MFMKTAVSVPDELFRQAEAEAKKLRISRSKLYASALSEFLDRKRSKSITRASTKSIRSTIPSSILFWNA